MQVRVLYTSSHVFLDFNLWICKIILGFRVIFMPSFAYFSEECAEKLVHTTLLGLVASILFNTIIVDPYPLYVILDSGMHSSCV